MSLGELWGSPDCYIAIWDLGGGEGISLAIWAPYTQGAHITGAPFCTYTGTFAPKLRGKNAAWITMNDINLYHLCQPIQEHYNCNGRKISKTALAQYKRRKKTSVGSINFLEVLNEGWVLLFAWLHDLVAECSLFVLRPHGKLPLKWGFTYSVTYTVGVALHQLQL